MMEDERFREGTPSEFIEGALNDPQGKLNALKASIEREREFEEKLQPKEPQNHESNPQTS